MYQLLTVCLLLVPHFNQDVARQPRDHAQWAKEIAKFAESDREKMPPKNAIVFAGSSSMVYWKTNKHFPDLVTINRGFGGSHLSDSVHFIEQVILRYEPRVVLVYAGDNDLVDGVTPQQIKDDFVKLTQVIHKRLPKTRVLYIAIKPSPDRWEWFEEQKRANRVVADICQQDNRLQFVDIVKPMLGVDGKPKQELFREDGLHLNEKGYALWASIVKPMLVEEKK